MKVLLSQVFTLTASVLFASLWSSAAHAAPIVVDWDVVPHEDRELAFDDSPHYDCSGVFYTERLCQSLWDKGMTLEATFFSFYDDKWFDGLGFGSPEDTLDPVQRIRPECKVGLDPCFDTFTPLTLNMSGHVPSSDWPLPNLFVSSSKGGAMKIPSVDGVATFNFVGDAWRDLDWIDVGFYLPSFCGDDEPPEGTERICSDQNEKALVVEDLTFVAEPAAVPEPALLSLIAAGALGVGMRRRYRA